VLVKRELAIVAVVVVAVAVVLALKFGRSDAASSTAAAETSGAAVEDAASSTPTVLLFADPREAGSSCGCAEVIRLARDAGTRSGVDFAEYDPRHAEAEAQRHEVRVSPTVLILDASGHETARFEGESPAVIDALREALGGLEAP
jgi:hypothetical protein